MISVDASAKKISTRTQAKRDQKRKRLLARERFKRSRLAEKAFARQLKSVARQVGEIVRGMAPRGVVTDIKALNEALRKYAQMLDPWARSVAQSMIDDIANRDLRAWNELGNELGRTLKSEIKVAPISQAMKALKEEQVNLIKSLPLEASQRVHKLTVEGMVGGTRAREIQKEILKTGKVTESRAMTIARTETSRTSTALVESRAQFVGSEGYIWRTAGDSDVRERHKHLEGKFIRWDSPPVAGDHGIRAHAGAIFNCRCYPEPVIPDDF